MHIDFVQEDELVTARLLGRLDTSTYEEVTDSLLQKFAKTQVPVVIDLADTGLISSAVLRVLLKCAKTLKKQGRALALCCANPQNLEVLEISGFLTIMAHFNTVEDARSNVLVD